ncbi:MAG TPA: phosphotransferase [Candidatus Bathyarchaeia archaeon]|nr:phosphotransferase [Candidatus Bathyarchaeia archaeon]
MQTQKEIVDALMIPDAYPEGTGEIELIQTHISFVFLTEKFVYKVKKAVNFGFLDFSTLSKRKFFCEKELELNRRLCPEIYLKVVPINKSKGITIDGDGETVEYALKMKRLPQETIMTCLLSENKVNNKTIDELAKIIARFHQNAQCSEAIDEFGSFKIIKLNWDENFVQTKKYVDQTIPKEEYKFLENQVGGFMKTNNALFEGRIKNGKIRDCHGDLHSGNIFITDRICIFDAIEFNDRFRYSDVASDVAFLAMDLDFQQRRDLADYLIDRYVAYSKDTDLTKVLGFYKCYRAYVRGKVISFKLDDSSVSQKEKAEASKDSKAYFKLAAEYAKKL